MKEIWFMRHAKSDWSNPDLVDFDRPLNKRGRRDASLMGEWIRENGRLPQLIVSSPAVRAKLTIKALLESIGSTDQIQWWDELYPGDIEATLKKIRALSSQIDHLLIVGHNPHLEELVSFLVADGHLRLRLPTASIALLQAILRSGSDRWDEFQSAHLMLTGIVTPKILGFKKRDSLY
jgi:phosphohistidine phosphatase